MADDYSCRVYGAQNNNVATLNRSTATAYKNGYTYVNIYVQLTKPAEEDTGVVVNIKDGNSTVATAVIYISKGQKAPTNGYQAFNSSNLVDGKTYNLALASASCQ